MVLELFTLCEGAFAKNGQLTIVNTLDSIISKQYPLILNLGVALKIKFPKTEYGVHEVAIQFKNSEDKEIVPAVKVNPSVESPNDNCNLVMSSNIQGIRIEQPGMYSVGLVLDGNIIANAKLEVK